jgi:hypothetical protein
MRRTLISSAVSFIAGVLVATAAPQVPSATPDSPGFHEFTGRVEQYLKLQKSMQRLRTTKSRKEIDDRRHALRQKIREARAEAKPGDIFTPAASEEFRRVIRKAFQGYGATNVRKTIRQGEPLTGWHLTINGEFPEHLPTTTVPPTLLLQLPVLPAEVAYRIIGHDFVLQDTEARMIVDFIPGVIP